MSEFENEIFKMPFDVWLLKSSFTRINGDLERVLKNDLIIILNLHDFNFQPLNPMQISKQSILDGGTTISMQIDYSYRRTLVDWIDKDLNSAKPIKGFEVVNLRTGDKLWICDYDMSNLNNYLLKKL